MRVRAILAVVSALTLLTSCTPELDNAIDPPTKPAPESSPPASIDPRTSTPSSSATSRSTRPAVPIPRSNAETLATGLALLRNGGVADVAEAEPPHGSENASVYGTLGDDLVFAGVTKLGEPERPVDVVATESIAGVHVETVGKPDQSLRFEYGAFRVTLRVTDHSGRYLDQKTRELLQVILCPSECGDVPRGADG